MTDTRRVVLVDLSNIFWSSWHAAANAKEQTQTEAAFSFTLSAVHRCRKEGELLAICLDVGKSFRKGLSHDYKAKRPEKDATALETLDRVKVRLKQDGCLLWGVNQYEADDVIAAATTAAVDAGHEVLVCTADKDLLQLTAKKGVKVLRTYNEWKTWDAETVRTTLGIEPYQMQDFLALKGDTSDTIKGADGIGDKTAVKLLQQFGDVPGIYEALRVDPAAVLPNAKPGISAASASLAACKVQVELALSLVRLNPPPLKFEEIYETRAPAPLVEREQINMDAEEDMGEFPAGFDAPKKEPSPGEAGFVLPSDPTVAAREAQARLAANAKAEPRQQTAVSVYQPPYEQALEPRSSQGAMAFAEAMINSRIFTKFPTPEAACAAIVWGRELGFGAVASMNAFHCMDTKAGKSLVMHAHAIAALVERHPDCEYVMCLSSDATQATYEAKNRRHPKPVTLKYTIEQARKAGVIRAGGPWDTRADEMLRKTCKTQLERDVFPGAAMGLYAIEEMGGDE